ncbi:biotin--[acetyl-CoA-carboxylase] ligase [Akkermansia sp.]|uniref:biotin--[acetyl-CoA-carboxylase] ligase n=1 Tax=Akkermansia sp. TaxID=1872421 RepID=UPI0025BDDD3C|nr:biotin--[acetyl-CoA-carboxylase] ligase [Akkermansia sp.]MCD8064190.1 biotin--[acetyl-CoA-carboxylase] ligase [Akkermansia sp.]
MNSTASFSTPAEEEGPCGDWTYHEWAEAFSTNDLARSLPPRHIAVCRVQTGGRGRFNRKWIGEEGGLWASFTIPLDIPADATAQVHWGHLPLVAGLALLNMLHGMGITCARLRWPNDVLAGKSKLAGILVERPAENMAVIGIGINVFNDVASLAGEIKDPPARLADLVQDCPSLHAVMVSLSSHLDRILSTFSHGGIPALQKGLARAWDGQRPVSILTDDETIRGIFTGIDDQGNPVLSLPAGAIRTVSAHLINRLIEE